MNAAAAAGGAEAGGAELGLADEGGRGEVDAADARGRGGHAGRERDDPAVGERDGDAARRRACPSRPGYPGRRDRRGRRTTGVDGRRIGRRGRPVRIAVAATALIDAGATHDAEPGRHAERAAARQDRLRPGLAVDVDHRAAGGPAVGHHEVAVRLDVDRAGIAQRRARREHGLRSRGRVHPHDLAVARDVQRPVQLDGDVARIVERRARRDGRDRARPGIDAAERDPVGHEQLPGLVHGEAAGVLDVGDVRQRAGGEVEPQHLVALPVGDVGLAVRRQRDAHRVLQPVAADHRVDRAGGSDREHGLGALVGHQQRAVGRDRHAHGSLSGAPPASSDAAPPLGRRSTRPELPNQLPSSAMRDVARRAVRRRGCDPEAGEGDERGREAAPHAGTASERISAANAATTAGSKFVPAQRSISSTASLTLRPAW